MFLYGNIIRQVRNLSRILLAVKQISGIERFQTAGSTGPLHPRCASRSGRRCAGARGSTARGPRRTREGFRLARGVRTRRVFENAAANPRGEPASRRGEGKREPARFAAGPRADRIQRQPARVAAVRARANGIQRQPACVAAVRARANGFLPPAVRLAVLGINGPVESAQLKVGTARSRLYRRRSQWLLLIRSLRSCIRSFFSLILELVFHSFFSEASLHFELALSLPLVKHFRTLEGPISDSSLTA